MAPGLYFGPGPYEWDDAHTHTYTDPTGEISIEHAVSIEWQHMIADVVNAVARAGLTIELLGEHPFTLFPRWPDLVQPSHGRYELSAGSPRLPLVYSLRARLPG